MHRTYQPYTAVTSVFLKQRWDKYIYKCHRRKVHAAKAVIDNGTPKVYHHLNVKLKKLQYEATRAEVIDRDNRMLHNKMEHIMRTGGRTDHKNRNLIYSKSLNAAKHKRELVRVATENSAILKRLGEREPNYNHKNLLVDWQDRISKPNDSGQRETERQRESQQYLKNISRYPPPARATPQRSLARSIQVNGVSIN